MKKIKTEITWENVIVAVFSVCLVIAPLMVNRKTLPMGWELPKVVFWQIVSLVVIFLGLVELFFNKKFRSKILKVNPVLLVLIGVVIVSCFMSDYKRLFVFDDIQNPVNNLIVGMVDKIGNYPSSIIRLRVSIFGNMFRDFGAVTFLLLVFMLVVISKNINSKNVIVVFGMYLVSALTQVAIGLAQFIKLMNITKADFWSGENVYGTFGQANFYVGFLIVGFIVGLFFTCSRSKAARVWGFVSAFLILIGIGISASFWGYIVAVACIFMYLAYRFLGKDNFVKFFYVALIGSVIFQLVIFTPVGKAMFLELTASRVDIWRRIIKLYIVDVFSTPFSWGDLLRLMFGSGFDTLGEVLQENRVFPQLYIDRAHNIFLDLISSVGIVGLGIFVFSLGKIFSKLKTLRNNVGYMFICIAVFLLVVRAMVHTNSIQNIVDLGLMVAVATSLAGLSASKIKTPRK